MLTQVVIQSAVPMTLNIDAADPDEILVVKRISGLSPADVTLFTGDFARDGGYYQGRRVTKRNPVIDFKMNPDYKNDIEVSDIRELLYSTFYHPQLSGDGVKVVLKDDRKPDRYFIGYTEKIETDLFSRDTDAQVSMISVEPYLLTDALSTASDAAGWASLPVEYDGSAPTGLELEILVKAATSTIVVDINGEQMVLNQAFAIGDVVKINTNIGQRYIRRGSTDIMVALTAASKWVQLKGRNNVIKVWGTAQGDGKAVLTKYSFRGRWWGI